MVSKILWVAATAVLQWLIVSSAFAQASVASDRAPSGLMIEEVVVTVSKRSESLQDVLGSVSALSGQMLAEQNIQDFRTMAQFMPGVIVQGEEAGSEQVAIRGISRTRDGPSPVAFHVNDLFWTCAESPITTCRLWKSYVAHRAQPTDEMQQPGRSTPNGLSQSLSWGWEAVIGRRT